MFVAIVCITTDRREKSDYSFLSPGERRTLQRQVRADFVFEAGLVMPDFETAKGGRVMERRFAVLLNMSAQLALENGFEKGAHFLLFAGGLKFHPAVREIEYGTGHVETLRDISH